MRLNGRGGGGRTGRMAVRTYGNYPRCPIGHRPERRRKTKEMKKNWREEKYEDEEMKEEPDFAWEASLVVSCKRHLKVRLRTSKTFRRRRPCCCWSRRHHRRRRSLIVFRSFNVDSAFCLPLSLPLSTSFSYSPHPLSSSSFLIFLPLLLRSLSCSFDH